MAPGLLVLFGGAAGAGKTTLALAWCATRERAALVELDAVRDLIVSGRVDPQDTSHPLQAHQYVDSVLASWSLARAFIDVGYDVALECVFEPDDFEKRWRSLLEGYDYRLVVVHPSLEKTLERSRARGKRVMEKHTRAQHAACAKWPSEVRVDTTELDVRESLDQVLRVIEL
jgi:chloramphenicol 3-O-phosphotransferase